MKNLRAVIFDLDGTLIDSSNGVVQAVNYSLRMMNLPEQPPEKIKPYIGFPLPVMYADFTDAPADELCRHFQVKANEMVIAATVALNGADRVLESLKSNGYRLAIATTKIRRNIDGILKKMNWEGYFDVTVGGDEVTKEKPDPEAFQKAIESLGVDPDDAIVVGDTVNDVIASKGIPVRVIAVKSPYGGKEELMASQPDYFVNTIVDVLQIIDGKEVESKK